LCQHPLSPWDAKQRLNYSLTRPEGENRLPGLGFNQPLGLFASPLSHRNVSLHGIYALDFEAP